MIGGCLLDQCGYLPFDALMVIGCITIKQKTSFENVAQFLIFLKSNELSRGVHVETVLMRIAGEKKG